MNESIPVANCESKYSNSWSKDTRDMQLVRLFTKFFIS